MLDNIGQWIQDVMGSIGYVGLALLLVLENLFPPIPSEVVLPLAGFFVGSGNFTFWGALLASTVGATVGVVLPLAGFLVGRGDFAFWGRSSPRRPGRRSGRSSCTAWTGGAAGLWCSVTAGGCG